MKCRNCGAQFSGLAVLMNASAYPLLIAGGIVFGFGMGGVVGGGTDLLIQPTAQGYMVTLSEAGRQALVDRTMIQSLEIMRRRGGRRRRPRRGAMSTGWASASARRSCGRRQCRSGLPPVLSLFRAQI